MRSVCLLVKSVRYNSEEANVNKVISLLSPCRWQQQESLCQQLLCHCPQRRRRPRVLSFGARLRQPTVLDVPPRDRNPTKGFSGGVREGRRGGGGQGGTDFYKGGGEADA